MTTMFDSHNKMLIIMYYIVKITLALQDWIYFVIHTQLPYTLQQPADHYP